MPESAALTMTKFMIPAACGTPVSDSTFTNGLWVIATLPASWVQGKMAAMTKRART